MARDSPGRFQSDPKAAPDGPKDRIMVPRWFPDAGKVAQDDPEMLQGSPERLPKSSVTARWPGLPEMLSRSSPGIPIWLQVPHECPKIAVVCSKMVSKCLGRLSRRCRPRKEMLEDPLQ